MAVTFDNILYPLGELNRSMFPDDTLENVAGVWFDEASSKVETLADGDIKDAATLAWVYYRAYTAVSNNIAAKPTSSSYYGNERSETWGGDRISYYTQKAKSYLEQFNTYVTPTVTYEYVSYSTIAKRVSVW